MAEGLPRNLLQASISLGRRAQALRLTIAEGRRCLRHYSPAAVVVLVDSEATNLLSTALHPQIDVLNLRSNQVTARRLALACSTRHDRNGSNNRSPNKMLPLRKHLPRRLRSSHQSLLLHHQMRRQMIISRLSTVSHTQQHLKQAQLVWILTKRRL